MLHLGFAIVLIRFSVFIIQMILYLIVKIHFYLLKHFSLQSPFMYDFYFALIICSSTFLLAQYQNCILNRYFSTKQKLKTILQHSVPWTQNVLEPMFKGTCLLKQLFSINSWNPAANTDRAVLLIPYAYVENHENKEKYFVFWNWYILISCIQDTLI